MPDDENNDYEPAVITAGEDRDVELTLRDERTTESEHVSMPAPDNETDWPSGWTAEERALTVAEDVDGPRSIDSIALAAEVEVAIVEDVADTTEADLDD